MKIIKKLWFIWKHRNWFIPIQIDPKLLEPNKWYHMSGIYKKSDKDELIVDEFIIKKIK